MNQNFLPLRTSDGRVLGVVPLAEATNFDETVTSTTIGGNAVAVEWITKQNDAVKMAVINLSNRDSQLDRWKQKFNTLIPITELILAPHWVSLRGLIANDLKQAQNSVLHFLATGNTLSAVSPTTVSPPVANNMQVTWNTTAQFIGTQACSFIDVNWIELTKTSFPDLQPVSAVIGAPTPATVNTFLRAYVVQMPTVYGAGGVINSTLRFIKVRADDPAAGTYVYPLVITGKNGLSTTVNVSLTIA